LLCCRDDQHVHGDVNIEDREHDALARGTVLTVESAPTATDIQLVQPVASGFLYFYV